MKNGEKGGEEEGKGGGEREGSAGGEGTGPGELGAVVSEVDCWDHQTGNPFGVTILIGLQEAWWPINWLRARVRVGARINSMRMVLPMSKLKLKPGWLCCTTCGTLTWYLYSVHTE